MYRWDAYHHIDAHFPTFLLSFYNILFVCSFIIHPKDGLQTLFNFLTVLKHVSRVIFFKNIFVKYCVECVICEYMGDQSDHKVRIPMKTPAFLTTLNRNSVELKGRNTACLGFSFCKFDRLHLRALLIPAQGRREKRVIPDKVS